jgi:hypothetical protein
MPEIVSTTVDDDDDVVSPRKQIREIREENEKSLLDYLKSLQSEKPIKVSILREFPKLWQGRSIEGTLDSVEDPISEEEIRDMYGGGKYKLVVYVPDARGTWVYATSRKIKIAGDPKVDPPTTPTNGQRDTSGDAVKAAMRMSQDMAERAQRIADSERERAADGNRDSGVGFVMSEMSALRRQMAEKDAKLFELATQKPVSSAVEMLLGKAIDGESARMAALRTQVDSEIRMKNEMNKAEIDRLHDRYEDITKRQDDANKREIDNLNRAFDARVESLKMAQGSVTEGYKREIAHLDRELTAAKTECAELRAKKEKGLIESVTELAKVREALEGFGGKDEGGSTWERIANSVMSSPLTEGIAARIAGGVTNEAVMAAAAQPAQTPEPEIPINRPVQLPDGRIIVRRAGGQIIELRRKQAAPPPPTGESAEVVSDEDLAIAAQFMESALIGDTEPADFARAARNLVPSLTSGPLQSLLRTQGVDAFLSRVAKLNPGSTLLSQAGKNWARKVAAALLES